MNVVLTDRAGELCEPDVAFAPVHPPEAVHELALVEFHVSVEELPEVTEVGLADNMRVGVGDGGGVEPVVVDLNPAVMLHPGFVASPLAS